MKHHSKVATPTIASGESASDVVPAENIRFADRIEVHAPDTLSGTVTVQVKDPDESDWDPYQGDTGSDITIPAGVVTVFEAPGRMDLRLNSGSSEAAERSFDAYGIEVR